MVFAHSTIKLPNAIEINNLMSINKQFYNLHHAINQYIQKCNYQNISMHCNQNRTRKLQMCNNKAVTKDQINDNFNFKSLLWYCKSPETFSTEVHKDEVTNAKWEWEKNRDETKNAWKQGTREGTRHSDIARKARGWETSIFTRRQWAGGT